jgi:hypothetical protein
MLESNGSRQLKEIMSDMAYHVPFDLKTAFISQGTPLRESDVVVAWERFFLRFGKQYPRPVFLRVRFSTMCSAGRQLVGRRERLAFA